MESGPIPIRVPDKDSPREDALDDTLDNVLGSTPPDLISEEIENRVSSERRDSGERRHARSYKTLPASSYSSLMPYQTPQVRDVLKTCFPDHPKSIVDATAHIGGDSILFSETFGDAKITSIDVDPNAIECLTYNIENFSSPERFEVICADSVEWIESKPPPADFYYFDPPWGGPRYYSKKEIGLTLHSTPIEKVINRVFELGLTKKVLLKVPRNFAYPAFKRDVRGTCKLFYIKKPQKNGSVAYGLVLVTYP